MKNKSYDVAPADKVETLLDFAMAVYPSFKHTTFHSNYYRVLDQFAKGSIKKLIVSVPPQHGKSLGASVLLPAYILGLDPSKKIAISSYNSTIASRFNRRAQRIIDSDRYSLIFPDTKIKATGTRSKYVRTSTHAEIIDRDGEIFSVGREGSLTGNEVDIFILDDLYKDAMEANSPIIRDNCWEWYTSVVKTRMHNNSSELIVFTRWHEEDLIGTLISKEKHIILTEWSQLQDIGQNTWVVVNFEALKESAFSEIDPRSEGDALWPERHSKEHLEDRRNLDSIRFNCMYQGKPSLRSGLLYGGRFKTYSYLTGEIICKGNYTDTADLGDDYLCSVCYETSTDGLIYITDIVYSRHGMEITENMVAEMLLRNNTRKAYIESNNGGRGFARSVAKLAPLTQIEWFHQSENKEARILSNSSTVTKHILMPEDWKSRWGEFSNHILNYRRLFRSNRYHDAADVLTGIIEKELINKSAMKSKTIRRMHI